MSSPSRRTSPAVGSMSRVMQRTSVDLPLPDRPMTTQTSPGRTSNDTSRSAIVEPVLRRSSSRDRSASGVPMILCSAGPKTFQRFRTARVGVAVPPSRVGPSIVAVTLTSPLWSAPGPRGSPSEPPRRCRCRVLPDVLRLTVLVQTARAKFPTDAGLLEAAPLGLGQVGVVVVDPDRPVAKSAGDALRRGPASAVQTAPARP